MTTVLYLGGLGRSGTTLLERLIGELPGAVALGEVVHLWERGVVQGEDCGCGVAFSACPFWSEAGKRAFGGWSALDLDRFWELRAAVDRTRHIPTLARRAPNPEFDAKVADYADHYLRLYRAAAELSGARLVVDSSKHASLAFVLSRVPGLDLRVVHVVRDSRGVANSWAKQIRRPEATDDSEAWMAQWSAQRVAAHWNAQNLSFGLLSRRRSTPVLRLRYEELTEDPVGWVRRIADFAGLVLEPSDLGFLGPDHAVLSANHTASGNPMRFQTGRIAIRRDEGWRERMPAADRRTVTALTAPLLRRYGYN